MNATVAQQAVKYYCMRQYNVGGKIHSQKNVTAGDDGVNQCAVACNALGQECGGFGVSVNKCFLMKAFNTSSSAADATLDALCMKSANDWLDFGIQSCKYNCSAKSLAQGVAVDGDVDAYGDIHVGVRTGPKQCRASASPGCFSQLYK